MFGAVAGHPPRNYFAALGDESAEQTIILIVYEIGFAFAKATYFSSSSFHLFSLFGIRCFDAFVAITQYPGIIEPLALVEKLDMMRANLHQAVPGAILVIHCA